MLFHGVLAPRAAWRRDVVPTAASQTLGAADPPPPENARASDPPRGWRWVDLMRRVFAVDVRACARCGGRLRLVATIDASDVTRRILGPGVDDWAS